MISPTRSWAGAGAVALAMLGSAAAGAAWISGAWGGLETAPTIIVAGAPRLSETDTLRRGQTVSELFARHDAAGVDWAAVARTVAGFRPSRLRAGLAFTFTRRGHAAPSEVQVRLSREARLVLTRTDSGWVAAAQPIAWQPEPVVLGGRITADASSVYEAVDAAVPDSVLPERGRHELVWDLADVYDWEIDFTRDFRPGDTFRVVAERLVSADGEVAFGRILGARIELSGKPLYAIRYDDGSRSEFYDETGHSLRREFLHNPLRFKRISSRFSRSRWQPILHYYRPHLGTDYAADYGTPVRTVGDGTVVFAGRDGGYGNLIEVRHAHGIQTRYGHLSKFAKGIRRGARVRQGEVIGYVGATGLATGPHLHFEVRKSGRAVNPLRYLGGATPGQLISAARRPGFEAARQLLMPLLDPGAGDVASGSAH